MEVVIYIVSIALQVTGALMLTIFAISTRRKDIIRAFAKSHMIVRDGNTKELSYDHEAFIDTYRTAYYSRISVGFIMAGYLLGIFGDAGDLNRLWIALSVVVMTGMLILIAKLIVEKLVQGDSVTKEITTKELEAAGAKADMESISNQVIGNVLHLGGTRSLK